MRDINQRIGLNIKRIREKAGLSQERLAALADLHRAYIGQIERVEKNIGLKNHVFLPFSIKLHRKLKSLTVQADCCKIFNVI